MEPTMTRVLLDAALRSKLHNLSHPLELCDDSGKVVGRVFPTADLSQYEPLEPQVSEEELDRREQADERRYTTAEVLAHLEKL
jgi:hypothetical protein